MKVRVRSGILRIWTGRQQVYIHVFDTGTGEKLVERTQEVPDGTEPAEVANLLAAYAAKELIGVVRVRGSLPDFSRDARTRFVSEIAGQGAAEEIEVE